LSVLVFGRVIYAHTHIFDSRFAMYSYSFPLLT
jgi:hypothetical protein